MIKKILMALLLSSLFACKDRSQTAYGNSYSTAPSSISHSSYTNDSSEGESEKAEFEDAAEELKSAVRGLQYGDWQYQMAVIRNRFNDADDALSRLESVRPDNVDVINARSELDAMKISLDRLYVENWRHVAPDLSSGALVIEDAASIIDLDD